VVLLQVLVYSVAAWSAPCVVEVKDTVLLLLQAEALFLLADPTAGLQLFSYQGRPLANPKWQGKAATPAGRRLYSHIHLGALKSSPHMFFPTDLHRGRYQDLDTFDGQKARKAT
jgi:hypothetical protein